jgi:hypothetical protein
MGGVSDEEIGWGKEYVFQGAGKKFPFPLNRVLYRP